MINRSKLAILTAIRIFLILAVSILAFTIILENVFKYDV
jgi:hypothetical protein